MALLLAGTVALLVWMRRLAVGRPAAPVPRHTARRLGGRPRASGAAR